MGHEYVKENETFNTSRNGVVYKPTQDDVNTGKVLKADGTWGEGGGGGTGDVEDVYVNGESVVDDEDKIAKITSYKEITQNEYTALPASKTSDGVLYCIKDAPSGMEGFPPLIYSDEEREVGVWRDGRPLYQKTIVSNIERDGSVSTAQSVNHGISNLGEVASLDGFVSFGSGGSWLPIIFSDNAGTTLSNSRVKIINVGAININFEIGNNYNGNNKVNKVRITICYTKSTDTVGSGTWTTQGALAHHYSTTEHIIGTWIDGKPVYEKTILCEIMPGGSKNTNHSIASLGTVVNITAITTGGEHRPIPFTYATSSSNSAWYAGITVDSTKVYIEAGSSFNHSSAYVTIQYTKTTD